MKNNAYRPLRPGDVILANIEDGAHRTKETKVLVLGVSSFGVVGATLTAPSSIERISTMLKMDDGSFINIFNIVTFPDTRCIKMVCTLDKYTYKGILGIIMDQFTGNLLTHQTPIAKEESIGIPAAYEDIYGIKAFVDKCIEPEVGASIGIDLMYMDYRDFVEQNSIDQKISSARQLATELRRFIDNDLNSTKGSVFLNTLFIERIQTFCGIKLKSGLKTSELPKKFKSVSDNSAQLSAINESIANYKNSKISLRAGADALGISKLEFFKMVNADEPEQHEDLEADSKITAPEAKPVIPAVKKSRATTPSKYSVEELEWFTKNPAAVICEKYGKGVGWAYRMRNTAKKLLNIETGHRNKSSGGKRSANGKTADEIVKNASDEDIKEISSMSIEGVMEKYDVSHSKASFIRSAINRIATASDFTFYYKGKTMIPSYIVDRWANEMFNSIKDLFVGLSDSDKFALATQFSIEEISKMYSIDEEKARFIKNLSRRKSNLNNTLCLLTREDIDKIVPMEATDAYTAYLIPYNTKLRIDMYSTFHDMSTINGAVEAIYYGDDNCIIYGFAGNYGLQYLKDTRNINKEQFDIIAKDCGGLSPKKSKFLNALRKDISVMKELNLVPDFKDTNAIRNIIGPLLIVDAATVIEELNSNDDFANVVRGLCKLSVEENLKGNWPPVIETSMKYPIGIDA